ncbi:MAG: acyl-CoA thioesterase [Boseongicola sp. SB0676_bin_33]|uniref:Acyl-CoA thioesterase n=1 Tax=Boseongicola sp. SB0664_bin_43 TaxID=2604844 RepID=A0A6B0Y035_9RHOB|nr:acyl-CoA thioesterase [Boseongicola sp. SB0664_bin_43]MYF89158.1 acyl-CoA thioesterase [Boseongicola sp. SB0676_bin_33]MYK30492.1 acyl-CoA thioesterase [Boseongicola sp. SB0670_bin_30]
MHFDFPQKVLFKHCDPAGIVFYPRHLEMINDAVEALFCDVLGWPFEEMLRTGGVPTAELNVRFKRPCRHGNRLVLRLTLTRLGRSSLALTTHATRGEELCFEADQVLVFVGADGRPAPWPEQVKDRIHALMETNA